MFLSRTCMLNIISKVSKVDICALFIANEKRQVLQRPVHPVDTGKLLEGVGLSSGVSASSQELLKTQDRTQMLKHWCLVGIPHCILQFLPLKVMHVSESVPNC